jgi:uncharacterized membrane protein
MWTSLRKSNKAPEMEILIPSLAILLAAVAAGFFLLPKLAPTILMASSAVVLAIAIYMHVKQFGVMEYERSTWQNNLKGYSSYIMYAVILIGAYGFYVMNRSGGSGMPTITTPTVGGGFDDVMRTAVSRINQLMRKGRISE